MAYKWPEYPKDVLSPEARAALDNWQAQPERQQLGLMGIIAAFPGQIDLEVRDDGQCILWTKTLATMA